MLTGKFIALPDYIKKENQSQINNLTLLLKELKKDQAEASRRKEIIKIRAQVNTKSTEKQQRNNETFENIKTDKSLVRLTKKKKRKDLNY